MSVAIHRREALGGAGENDFRKCKVLVLEPAVGTRRLLADMLLADLAVGGARGIGTLAEAVKILAAAGYPFLDQHRLRHQSFRAFVANTASGARPASAPELFSYLVDWWVGHIATDDKSYREFLDGKDALIAEALAEVQAPTIVKVAPKGEDLAGLAAGARPEDYRDRIDRV